MKYYYQYHKFEKVSQDFMYFPLRNRSQFAVPSTSLDDGNQAGDQVPCQMASVSVGMQQTGVITKGPTPQASCLWFLAMQS